jgi:hypothetical protein
MSYTRISILRLVQGAQAAFGGGDGSEETLGIGECLGCESEEDEVITMAPVQHAIAGATGARSELAQAEVAPAHSARVWKSEFQAARAEHPSRVEHRTELARLVIPEGGELCCEGGVVPEFEGIVWGHARTVAPVSASPSVADWPIARGSSRG